MQGVGACNRFSMQEINAQLISVLAVLFIVPVARAVTILARRITKATYKSGIGITFEFGEKDKKLR